MNNQILNIGCFVVQYVQLSFPLTANVDESCENPVRVCQGNSGCSASSGVCVCASGYVQSGTTCISDNG